MIFQYGLEPVQIQRILIGFEAILEMLVHRRQSWKVTLENSSIILQKSTI